MILATLYISYVTDIRILTEEKRIRSQYVNFCGTCAQYIGRIMILPPPGYGQSDPSCIRSPTAERKG